MIITLFVDFMASALADGMHGSPVRRISRERNAAQAGNQVVADRCADH
jgi:hypothetical protein